MKSLIVHDYLDNIGGGEKLMLTLAREIGADVATLDYNREVVAAMGFNDVNITGFGKTSKTPPLKQIIASIRHYLADYGEGYDYFIFSGNWSRYCAKKHHPNMWYCYTPVRAFYLDYQSLSRRLGPLRSVPFRMWVSLHKRFDMASIKHTDKIVTISGNVRERTKRIYGRDSKVIYPGTDTKKYRYRENGDFWLSVNRLYPEKRVHLQADTFKRLPKEKLVVVGGNLEGDHSSGYVKELMKNRPSNVEYKGRITEEELVDLYARCKGFICTAVDEDFGMTPVEAMAAGKPVIATREGGYTETVLEGKTGEFIEPTEEGLAKAVEYVGKDPKRYRTACTRRAAAFDTGVFIKAMRKEMSGI